MLIRLYCDTDFCMTIISIDNSTPMMTHKQSVNTCMYFVLSLTYTMFIRIKYMIHTIVCKLRA